MAHERQRTIRNERFKLAAQAFDRASTACLLAGIISPAALGAPLLSAALFGWIALALVLHLIGSALLGGLR